MNVFFFAGLLALSTPGLAQDGGFYEVAGAPQGCSSAYVFPRSAPMMAEGYGGGFAFDQSELLGTEWGSCTRMVPHDGSEAVWVMMIWDPGFRGNAFCKDDDEALVSPVVVVQDETTPTPAVVKTKWYLSPDDLEDGEIPTTSAPCPAGSPPEPDPAAVAALHDGTAADAEERKRRTSFAGLVDLGPTNVLDNAFAFGFRVGLGMETRRFWLGGGFDVHSFQALPDQDGPWFNRLTFSPTLWTQLKMDDRGMLRLHAYGGGGPARYQRSKDEDTQVLWSADVMGGMALSYQIINVAATWYGPGGTICEGDPNCDIPWERQLTFGVILIR